jgi:hypothetical protein
MQQSLTMHPTEDLKRLPLQRMFLPYNTHALPVLDVGSLSYSSSIPSTTTG